MSIVKNRSGRRDSNSTKRNVLNILIPGLKQSVDIEFPDGKLPVCERCKKIYKTRELCRVRDGHTDIPWNTTYLCISFDDSCLTLNAMNEVCLVDEERMQCRFTTKLLDEPPLPFRAKNIHEGDIHSPICTPCKEKNYTRHHCREKQQHTQLPWVTAYIMLSATPHSDLDDQMHPGVMDHSRMSAFHKSVSSPKNSENSVCTSSGKDCSDDIHKVQKSRSCLLTVNSSSSTIRWLEIDPCIPKTDFRPIPNFTGIPSNIMNQWHGRNPPFTSTGSNPYTSIENLPLPRSKFDQQYHPSYPGYPNWPQNAEYQGRGPPMHSQGPPVASPFCEYQPAYLNSYQYQQAEQNMRNPYASNYGQHHFPLENPNSMQEISKPGYYNSFYSYHNTPYPQGQMNASPYPSEHYSKSPPQQESRGAPWSNAAPIKQIGNYEGRTHPMDQSPTMATHGLHSTNGAHIDGGDEANRYSQSLEEDQYPREYYT